MRPTPTPTPYHVRETAPAEPAVPMLRPWIAVVLSLLSAGLGHVYSRRFLRAFVVLVVMLGVVAAASALLLATWLPWNAGLWLGMTLAFAAIIGVAFDAARIAGTTPRPPLSSARRVVEIASAFVLLFALGMLAPEIPFWRRPQSFDMPSGAMQPTLLPGDAFYIDSGRYDTADPMRGDIVVFPFPDNPTAMFAKRIIGLPGDRIEVDGDRVVLNGVELPHLPSEPLGAGWDRYVAYIEELPNGRRHRIVGAREASRRLPQRFDVPAGHYFMLGDNRPNSSDSRKWARPFVPREDLLGPVVQIYFSRDPTTGELRTDRIGPIESADP